jgi:N-dimethylarginine dimethylaminohydrolase
MRREGMAGVLDIGWGGAAAAASPNLACASERLSLRTLGRPAFLMSLPLFLSADEPNNVLMEAMSERERCIDCRKAMAQFLDLYRFIASRAVVYLLPSRPALQDQPYVANLGVVLPHLDRETVVVSRFRSPPRIGESAVGADFLRLFEFDVQVPPTTFHRQPLYFEGEADLKHVRGNLYVGAHGLRTSQSALRWFAENFGMEMIGYPILDDHLYHLDCCLFFLNDQEVVLSRKKTAPEALRAIERHCNIVDATVENVRSGMTNGLMLENCLLCDSPLEDIGRFHPYYPSEKRKIAKLEKICAARGLDLRIFNLSEFLKSGAALSCLVMRLNEERPTRQP